MTRLNQQWQASNVFEDFRDIRIWDILEKFQLVINSHQHSSISEPYDICDWLLSLIRSIFVIQLIKQMSALVMITRWYRRRGSFSKPMEIIISSLLVARPEVKFLTQITYHLYMPCSHDCMAKLWKKSFFLLTTIIFQQI